MELSPWIKIFKENHRIEVEHYRIADVREKEQVADDLNDLFRGHSDWKDFNALVNYDEIGRCIFVWTNISLNMIIKEKNMYV